MKVLSLVTLEEDESHWTAMTASQSTKKLFLAAVCPPAIERMKNHLLLFFIGIQAGRKFPSAELKKVSTHGLEFIKQDFTLHFHRYIVACGNKIGLQRFFHPVFCLLFVECGWVTKGDFRVIQGFTGMSGLVFSNGLEVMGF